MPPESNSLRALVLENNEVEFRLIRRHLTSIQKYRFEIDWSSDPQDVWEKLKSHDYDVVFADYRLDGIHQNGLDLLVEVAAVSPCITVLLTNDVDQELGLKTLRRGVDDFIPKDEVSPTLIQRTIEHAFERHSQAQKHADQEQKLTKILKLSALGELATGIAHEINNPLAITVGKATLALKKVESKYQDAEIIDDLEKALRAAKRINQIVQSLKSLTRTSDRDEKTIATAKDIIDDALELCAFKITRARAEVALKFYAEHAGIYCHPHEVSQILINLICNACDALENQNVRKILIEVSQEGDQTRIEVSDTGPGIPDELRSKILEPYFTTKEKGKGTGLGLSISCSIARQHGGSLELDDESPATKFCLSLPKAMTKTDRAKKKVLVVDDNSLILDILNSLLKEENLGVTCCESAEVAKTVLADGKETFDLVLTDANMPGVSGEELYQWTSNHIVPVPDFIFMSGDREAVESLREKFPGSPVVEKPFEPLVFLGLIQNKFKGPEKDKPGSPDMDRGR